MRRVLLIGPGGAGKSALAQALAERTGLPLVHLDAVFWRPGWQATPRAEWVSAVERLVQSPEWIMDGNYGGTLSLRLAACDTVVLLDLPAWRCLWRAMKRRLLHRGRSRPDMADGCPEKLEASYLWWVATYRSRRLPRVLGQLKAAERAGKAVAVLRTPSAVARFLSEAPTHGPSPGSRPLQDPV